MRTNIFMNPYQQPENKLTYSFLALIELINNKDFMEWLCEGYFAERPVENIEGVLGGANSNPDGKITLKDRDGSKINIYIENKTNRRQLSVEQLISHLEWLENTDRLLVITPRVSDKKIITNINRKEIIFRTWSEIAEYLSKHIKSELSDQFVDYGRLSGEFDENGELTKSEIEVYSSYYKMNFEGKFYSIFNSLSYELNIIDPIFKNIQTVFKDNWGRKGLEFSSSNNDLSYGQWWALSLYYSTRDHGIKLIKQVPELVFFFDVNCEYKKELQFDNDFASLVNELAKVGFESNLNNELTTNSWRLLVYRKPITDFESINLQEMIDFTIEVISKLKSANAFSHNYFKEYV